MSEERYIDVDEAVENIREGSGSSMQKLFAESCLYAVPTADVVPKKELDNLQYTLAGVMHSVDKWLEDDELEKDEVNRAILMREKLLVVLEHKDEEIENRDQEIRRLTKILEEYALQHGTITAKDSVSKKIQRETARDTANEIISTLAVSLNQMLPLRIHATSFGKPFGEYDDKDSSIAQTIYEILSLLEKLKFKYNRGV